jgi:hypothetical protein
MSEDLSFQIQLGLILPKFKDKLTGDMTEIVEELVGILKAGNTEGSELSFDEVKALVMKDFEIFISTSIFPEIEKKHAPAEEAVEGESSEGEEGGEEAAE